MKKWVLGFIVVGLIPASLGCAGSQRRSTTAYASTDGYVYDTEGVPDYVVIESDQGFAATLDDQDVTVVVEPEPLTVVEEVPPERPATVIVVRPPAPYAGAIWVDGYWRYGSLGFVWVAGHYVPPRAGYVFVGPRWVYRAGRYHHFPGYYRPRTAYVRTYYSHSHYYRPHSRPYHQSPPRHHYYGRVSYHGRASASPGRGGHAQRPVRVPATRPMPARPTRGTPQGRPRPNRQSRVAPPAARPLAERRVVPPVSRPAGERPRVAPPVARPSAERPRVVPPVSRPAPGGSRVAPPVARSGAEQRSRPPARATVARPPQQSPSSRQNGPRPTSTARSKQGRAPHVTPARNQQPKWFAPSAGRPSLHTGPMFRGRGAGSRAVTGASRAGYGRPPARPSSGRGGGGRPRP